MPPAVEARYSLTAMGHPRRSLDGATSPPDPGGRYLRTGPAPDGWATEARSGLAADARSRRQATQPVDPAHIGNGVLREDARGARLAKERRDSPQRIDAAVAAVMAHDRAAALAGVTRNSIYL